RNHGDTGPAPPPQTLTSCADDLWELSASCGERPAAVIGHSFGGKVALRFAEQAGQLGSTGPGALQQVWVLDAAPGPWPGDPEDDAEVVAVIRALESIPQPVQRRDEVAEALRARGFSPTLAAWMTTNLRRTPDGYRWRFHLPAVREMIADYFVQDLWPVLEDPAPGLRIDVVRAERSDRWTDDDLARFAALPADGAVHLHRLPDSGHWVHVDAPEALIAMIAPSLRDGAPPPAPGPLRSEPA
ncbi:MAG: alpha/beta hydrolase, partial [Deltaproteobacteria bacterium]